jgi:diguanylate cyclase (GGDEF)-like protein
MLRTMGPVLAFVTAWIGLVIAWLLRTVWTSTKKLDQLAFRDSLTGLANRAMFDLQLARSVDRTRSTQDPVAVLLADVDRFKNVNDSLGHPAGDELIQQVASRLRAIADQERDALVARVGGDEFAVILPGVSTVADVERLGAAVVAVTGRPFSIRGETVFSGVSVGVALSDACAKPEELFRWADIALFEAKSRGRGCVVAFTPQLDEIVLQRQAIERDLRSALQNDRELNVAYQPIFDANGTTIVGAEALLRWHHPVHDGLSPDVVIAIAEERGLISSVAEIVLRQACEFLRADSRFPWIAVNVSGGQFRDAGFATTFLEIVRQFDIEPRRLQIEITETSLIENADTAEATLARLHDAGVVIALDDFWHWILLSELSSALPRRQDQGRSQFCSAARCFERG